MIYVGTFITGWTDEIKKILKNKYSDITIINILDGLIVFKSEENMVVQNFPFLNNLYLMIGQIKYKNSNFNENVLKLVNRMNMDFNSIKKFVKQKDKTFKILGLNENNPCSIDYKNILKFENNLSKNLNLKVDRKNHDLDFIFMQRREGFMYFLLKLSYNSRSKKHIKSGSLRPEMSYLLASFADIKKSDVILDPFCGSGSIPKTIVKYFKYNMCFSSDIEKSKVSLLKKEFKKTKKNLYISNLDALKLDKFENDFIDVIITDPPWNIYNKDESINFEIFYTNMLLEMKRVLKINGRIIILMGNISDFEKALENTIGIIMLSSFSTLVNGKKTNVYHLIKE